jgi:hypothetical protein
MEANDHLLISLIAFTLIGFINLTWRVAKLERANKERNK